MKTRAICYELEVHIDGARSNTWSSDLTDGPSVNSIVTKAIMSAAFVLMLLFVDVLSTVAQTELPNDPQSTCTVSKGVQPAKTDTAEFASWFHSGTAALNGVVDPADSVAFPNNPNCSFYQWSQRMFLWLTSPAPASYGGGGGRIFASPAFFTVSPEDSMGVRTLIPNAAGRLIKLNLRAAQVGVHGLPVIMSKQGQMFEVLPAKLSTAGKPLVLNRAGQQVEVGRTSLQDGKVILIDRAGKPIQAPKLIVPKQISSLQLKSLPPQQELMTPEAQPRTLEKKSGVQARLKASAIQQELARSRALHPVNPQLIAQRFLIDGRPIFLNVSGGVIDVEQNQADPLGGVLLAQNGSLIYYVTMVNDVYAYFLTGTKNGGILPKPTQFPTSAADLTKITTFASAHGKTFPDPNALAIEVKSAWIETTGIANPGDYITTQAVIPTYDKTNPNQWVPNGQKTTTLALVGIHVVGSTAGHPEMIWATFEHFGNTPNADFNYNSTTGPKTVHQSNPITGTWLFCATGATAPFNQEIAKFLSPNIVSVGAAPIGPSNILRFKPFGAALNVGPNPLGNDAFSNTEIISIDNNVSSLMNAASAGGDVRQKYYMTGATWTINGFGFNGNFGNPGNNTFASGTGVGTSQIANTTMETFQQTTTAWDKFSNNCFSCHGSNTTGVSHIFAATKPLF